MAFSDVAPYYDLLMQDVPYGEWLEYYQQILKRQNINPKSYLDLCCGTGILSEALHTLGHHVEGLDLSKEMIRQAKHKAQLKGLPIKYHIADATDFQLDNTYEAVFSFFDSLNYILDTPLLKNVFECVYQHLTPGGSFIFDLNTAYAFESNLFDQKEENPTAPLRYEWKGYYNDHDKIIQVYMDFWTNEGHFHEVHSQKAHDINQLKQYLTEVGFIDIQIFQSYTFKKLSKYTDRVHFAALKPN